MTAKTITYKHRGRIEVAAPRNGRPGFAWREAYSADSDNGAVSYPWMTKRQCQADAKAQGKRAQFA